MFVGRHPRVPKVFFDPHHTTSSEFLLAVLIPKETSMLIHDSQSQDHSFLTTQREHKPLYFSAKSSFLPIYFGYQFWSVFFKVTFTSIQNAFFINWLLLGLLCKNITRPFLSHNPKRTQTIVFFSKKFISTHLFWISILVSIFQPTSSALPPLGILGCLP